jgi:hypothetical protein
MNRIIRIDKIPDNDTDIVGPVVESRGVHAVYIDSHRYWITLDRKLVMDADPKHFAAGNVQLVYVIGGLRQWLLDYVKRELEQGKCGLNLTVVLTDKEDFVFNDHLLRTFPCIFDKISMHAKVLDIDETIDYKQRMHKAMQDDIIKVQGERDIHHFSRSFLKYWPGFDIMLKKV